MHRNNMIFYGRAIELGCPTLTRFFSHEILAQRRLRRDNRDLLALELDLQATVPRPDKIRGPRAVAIQFDQRSKIDRLATSEILDGEGRVNLNRIHDLLCLAGLTAGEIGRFQAARVVLVLGLAALVSGLRVRSSRGLAQELKAFAKAGDNLFQYLRLVTHTFKRFRPVPGGRFGNLLRGRLWPVFRR